MYGLETILALTSRFASLFLDAAQSGGSVAFHDPTPGGGSMLINALNGYGEPLNVRLSPCLFM
jgi:hypothetical protein